MQLHKIRFNKGGALKIPVIFVAAGVLVLITALTAWWLHQRNDPGQVFFGMLENNLRTTSVTRSTFQEGGNQQVSQNVRLVTAPNHIARSITTLTQTGTVSAHAVTETIGTPSADYVQYVDIDTSQTNEQGETVDYSSVVNVWGVLPQPDPASTSGELYNEMVLGAVPFARLGHESRENLMRLLRDEDVYQIDGEPEKIEQDGRPTYVYNVTVQPAGYIQFLKQLGEEVGLTQFASLDPQSYADAEPFGFTVTVDILSQRLTGIQYEDGRTERYGGYGVRSDIDVPEDTIPLQELQTRIQDLQ